MAKKYGNLKYRFFSGSSSCYTVFNFVDFFSLFLFLMCFYTRFFYKKVLFGPIMKLSWYFHDSHIKTFLRLSQQTFLSSNVCVCNLMESEKAPCSLEMIMNLSRKRIRHNIYSILYSDKSNFEHIYTDKLS